MKWSEWPVVAGASIAAKELLPIIAAAAIWGPQWGGSSVLCHCDNEAVVAVVRGGYCRDPTLAHMLRCLLLGGKVRSIANCHSCTRSREWCSG